MVRATFEAAYSDAPVGSIPTTPTPCAAGPTAGARLPGPAPQPPPSPEGPECFEPAAGVEGAALALGTEAATPQRHGALALPGKAAAAPKSPGTCTPGAAPAQAQHVVGVRYPASLLPEVRGARRGLYLRGGKLWACLAGKFGACLSGKLGACSASKLLTCLAGKLGTCLACKLGAYAWLASLAHAWLAGGGVGRSYVFWAQRACGSTVL